MKRYLVMDIGCLECDEESNIVCFADTLEEAEDAARRAAERQAKNWTGQHEFEIFDLETGASVMEEMK